MATSVTEVLRRVRHLIQDSAGIRWPDEELLLWLNDAQRDLVTYKPDASAVTATITCATGTRQTLPAGGAQLLDIVRNMTGAQRAVRRIERAVLDAETPEWHGASSNVQTRWFTYDARNPTVFYISPPATISTQLEIVYSKIPDLLSMDDDIGLEDIYTGPLVDYVCYRAFAKDTDFAQSAERARMHFSAYMATVTGKQMAEHDQVQQAGESTDAVR